MRCGAGCRAIAGHNGYTIGPSFDGRANPFLVTPSPLTASMLRDPESGVPTGADHIIGDLIARGGAVQQDDTTLSLSLLRIACTHLKTDETRRARRVSCRAGVR